jgi:hypothetical protein
VAASNWSSTHHAAARGHERGVLERGLQPLQVIAIDRRAVRVADVDEQRHARPGATARVAQLDHGGQRPAAVDDDRAAHAHVAAGRPDAEAAGVGDEPPALAGDQRAAGVVALASRQDEQQERRQQRPHPNAPAT